MIEVHPLSADTPALEALELFRAESSLLALPVTDRQSDYLGTISRRSYLNFFSRAYARDLYARKGLSDLFAAQPELAKTPLVARGTDRVDQIIQDLFAKDPELTFDALPVVSDRRVCGVVTIARMMLSLSEAQGQLIDTMETLSQRLQEEISHAAMLQRNLLPPGEIELPGIRGHAWLIPSSEVGGDYYDYYVVENRWVVLLIGDVSGHGVASGTMVSAAKAGVSLLAADAVRDPGIVLGRLNQMILHTAQQKLLMTMVVTCLDTHTGVLRYANAGHQFPYAYRAITGVLEPLEVGGLPLGRHAEPDYQVAATELDVGDRLFLYTDGVVEELDANDEAFGYDRLEALLTQHMDEEPAALAQRILEHVSKHAATTAYSDDITLFCVEHYERLRSRSSTAAADDALRDLGIVRIAEAFYRANSESFSPRIARQNLVLLAEHGFADLLPRLSADGIRRVLPRHQQIVSHLGWNNILSQHTRARAIDLVSLVPAANFRREYTLTHSDDKQFIVRELESSLQDLDRLDHNRIDALVLLCDELVENGLYAAPRDGKGRALFVKGIKRALEPEESLHLAVAMDDTTIGLSLTDNWGTLTPAVFLNRLARHVQGDGLIAGIGGAGFFLLWRLADYLQLRVNPSERTQVTVLMDLRVPVEMETDNGFQFLFHSEVQETVSHDRSQFDIANPSTAFA